MERAIFGLLLLGIAGLAACAPSEEPAPVELETEEIAPAIDADLTTEGDLQAVQRTAELTGVLPGGVPPDLPLFIPASVVDFGELGPGRAWVELDVRAAPDRVRAWLAERLPAAGWTVASIGSGGLTARKGAREVAYRLTDLAPGTRIRLEYRPE